MTHCYKFVDTELFPNNEGIYGVGISMGGNYLLRSVGAPNDLTQQIDCKFKAVATIAQCYDVLTTCVLLQFSMFGLYDILINSDLRRPFRENRYTKHWY